MTLLATIAAALSVLAFGTSLAVFVLLRREPPEQRKLRAEFDDACNQLRRDFALALEDAAKIGETIERHRRKIDASQARTKRPDPEATPAPEPELTEADELAAIRRRARARGMA